MDSLLNIWAESGGVVVIKRADGGPGRSLPNEQNIHGRILAAAKKSKDDEENAQEQQEKSRVKVNIPLNLGFLEQTSPLWPQILLRLPSGFTSCQALVSERIPPMSLAVRELLASHYCPSKQNAMQLARDKSNESCLIRPYLGRRRPEQKAGPKQRFFSLRNFPLHIDQMEDLCLPAGDYALAMADALAFLHWTAKVDACDVEYVLAPAQVDTSAGASFVGKKNLSSEAFGNHGMWILDFDCCKALAMDGEGMRRAAMCFWRNDPFYPRPGAKTDTDRRMWDVFERQFLKRSGDLLRDESEDVKKLPEVLIQTIRKNRDTWTKGAINE